MLSTLPALVLLLLLSFLIGQQTSARPEPQVTIQPTNPQWRNFTSLIDAEPGSRLPGTSELKQYLARFGYLPATTTNFTDSFDETITAAVARYQTNHGLPSTGRLDDLTVRQIISPRCGVTDTVAASDDGVVSHFAFFPGHPRWAGKTPITLTYALSPTDTIDYISHNDMISILRRAFSRWASVIPVSFIEVADYDSADVKLAFYSGDHGDGEPFDGVLGVLAHAFSPESGRLHLDAAERWAVDFGQEESAVAVDLESVVTHEIGHVLGLAHSTVKESIMFPSLSPRTRKVDLRVDDVQGVQVLYGSNPNFSFSSLLEDTSSADSTESITVLGIIWRASIALMLFCV